MFSRTLLNLAFKAARCVRDSNIGISELRSSTCSLRVATAAATAAATPRINLAKYFSSEPFGVEKLRNVIKLENSKVEEGEVIGTGREAVVCKGKLTLEDDTKVDVAIKTPYSRWVRYTFQEV